MQTDSEKLLAEMFLELKQVKALLHDLVQNKPQAAEGWAESGTAWISLQGEGVKSQKHLQKLRCLGAFSEAKGEIRNVSQGDRPTWQYNIPLCRKALNRYFKSLKSA